MLIPDTGRQYLSKVFNDEWMRDNRYMGPAVRLSAKECVRTKRQVRELQFVAPTDSALAAMSKMEEMDISQLPVFENGSPTGSITEDRLVGLVLQGHDLKSMPVADVMEPSFPVVDPDTTIDQITDLLRGESPAVFVRMGETSYEILTKYDVVHTIAGLTEVATGA